MTDKVSLEDLQKAFAELEKATVSYEDAKQVESSARSRCTSALNAMNECQKRVDRLLDEFTGAAPHDSDWGRKKRDKGLRRAS